MTYKAVDVVPVAVQGPQDEPVWRQLQLYLEAPEAAQQQAALAE